MKERYVDKEKKEMNKKTKTENKETNCKSKRIRRTQRNKLLCPPSGKVEALNPTKYVVVFYRTLRSVELGVSAVM